MPDKAIINKTNLEEFGKNGYMMYRIPGIIVSPRNIVLSYYEARMGKGDWTKQVKAYISGAPVNVVNK